MSGPQSNLCPHRPSPAGLQPDSLGACLPVSPFSCACFESPRTIDFYTSFRPPVACTGSRGATWHLCLESLNVPLVFVIRARLLWSCRRRPAFQHRRKPHQASPCQREPEKTNPAEPGRSIGPGGRCPVSRALFAQLTGLRSSILDGSPASALPGQVLLAFAVHLEACRRPKGCCPRYRDGVVSS